MRPPHLHHNRHFSGLGNQQKLILAREMSVSRRFLLVGQPIPWGGYRRHWNLSIANLIAAVMLRSGAAVCRLSWMKLWSWPIVILVMVDGASPWGSESAQDNERELGLLMTAAIFPSVRSQMGSKNGIDAG